MEATRERLAQTIDELVYRASPKTIVRREITSVKARLQRMNPVEEQAGYNRMFGDLVALETRRRALVDRAAGG